MGRKSGRRKQFRGCLSFFTYILIAAVIVAVFFLWPTPEVSLDTYLAPTVNGAAVVRLQTADNGFKTVLDGMVGGMLTPEEMEWAQTIAQEMTHARAWIFLSGGAGNVYNTRALAVAHVKRLGGLVQKAIHPLLEESAYEPDRVVGDVDLLPMDFGGWLSVSRRAVLYATDLDWLERVVRAHEGLPAQAPQEATDERTRAFFDRIRALNSPHEIRATALYTPHRRKATERLALDLLLEFATYEQEKAAEPYVKGLMTGVDVVDVEVDLRPDQSAWVTFTFEMESEAAALEFQRRLNGLNASIDRLLAGLGFAVDPIGQRGRQVFLEVETLNTTPFFAGIMEF